MIGTPPRIFSINQDSNKKQNIMKQLLLLLGLFISLSMAARDFKYDGIIYTVID